MAWQPVGSTEIINKQQQQQQITHFTSLLQMIQTVMKYVSFEAVMTMKSITHCFLLIA
jgi:hypothetical protein